MRYILLVAALLCGCSTIINGQRAEVKFDSTPVGADVWVDGMKTCTTPCTAELAHGAHRVRFLRDGSQAVDRGLTASFSGWSLVGIGLVFPLLIDLATGAATSLDQRALAVDLPPEVPTSSASR